MSTLRLFRVILPVDDLERAATFYAALLAEPEPDIHCDRADDENHRHGEHKENQGLPLLIRKVVSMSGRWLHP